MIRTDAEYQEARKRILDEKTRLGGYEAQMKQRGLKPDELERFLDPLRSFTMQLEEEVEAYERTRRGSFDTIENLHGLGRLLIAARIFRQLSQRDLAATLDVHESQVSRDERNEYRGITIERAQRILDALGVQLKLEMLP